MSSKKRKSKFSLRIVFLVVLGVMFLSFFINYFFDEGSNRIECETELENKLTINETVDCIYFDGICRCSFYEKQNGFGKLIRKETYEVIE